jgi:hypothetical protein
MRYMVRSLVSVGLLALASGGGQLLAQGKPGEPEVLPKGVMPGRGESAFSQFADRDYAWTGMRMPAEYTGYFRNQQANLGITSQGWDNFNPDPVADADWFGMFFYFAAPPSERNKHAAGGAPSLANANNKGYTVNSQLSTIFGEVIAMDQSLGPYHSGATDSGAGDCLDFRIIGSGNPLLAASDCEPTWGSLGWQGTRPVDGADGWLDWAADVGDANFSFDDWRVPLEFKDTTSFIGAFQSFAFWSDYSSETLFGSSVYPAYNNVVPGGTGAATRTGWPLGMKVKMDMFSWPAANLTNTAWLQLTVTNESEAVYGVGLDYDSLYMGFQNGYLTFGAAGQGSSNYRDPTTNAIRVTNFCTGITQTSSKDTGLGGNGCGPGEDPAHTFSDWGSSPPNGVGAGFPYGAIGFVVLKSPIGDMRNKLLTDPTSDFFGKGDPETWDDTINFNHGHMCGFHGCSRYLWNATASTSPTSDFEQRQFGMVASITSDVVGDRDPSADITNHIAWDTWRWEEYPNRTPVGGPGGMDFNFWTPGNWDWDDDGFDDVLAWDDCSDNAGLQFDPIVGVSKRCAAAWTDTMTSGWGNLYSNRGSVVGVGPLQMAAGDTVQWIVAIVMANDLTNVEAGIAEAVAHYQRFYLLPEPAPAPNIVSIDVQQGGGTGGVPDPISAPAAAITLYWDDTTDEWQDPFVNNLLNTLVAAPAGSPFGRVRDLNPFLTDTLAWLQDNNVEFIHVFKSCDGGGGFTDDGNCADDPATGPGSIFTQAGGWLPYLTFEPDEDGNFDNTLTDNNVFGGRSFLYSMNPETRGLTISIKVGDATAVDPGTGEVLCTLNCTSQILDIPKLLPIVQTSTSLPNVVDVYIPIANQAGSSGTEVTLVTGSPDYIPFDRMNVTATSQEVTDGDYTLAFADSVRVVESEVAGVVTRTIVYATDFGVGTETYTVGGAVSLTEPDDLEENTAGDTVTRKYTYDQLTSFVLDANDRPLIVSAELEGSTVPGSFYGLPNYPGFVYDVDNSGAGSFPSSGGQYYTDANGDTIRPLVEPSVTWRNDLASGISLEGRYAVGWLASAFGAGSPFTLNFSDAAGTKAAIVASLEGRTGETTATGAAVAAALGVAEADLATVNVPFFIEDITADLTTGEELQIAMLAADKITQILVGVGLDTMYVDVPATEWVPGDEMWLLDASNNVLAQTAILGCNSAVWTRLTCNPVELNSPGASGYIENAAQQTLYFQYLQTITAETEYEFNLASAVRGEDVIATDNYDAIRASLDSVKVVPNPYVMYSEFATSGGTDRVIFTHMPPNGVLRVYTVTGQFVQKINWGPNDLNGNGDLFFNLRTREGNEMGAGLFLFVLTAKDENGGEIGTARGKFVLIK